MWDFCGEDYCIGLGTLCWWTIGESFSKWTDFIFLLCWVNFYVQRLAMIITSIFRLLRPCPVNQHNILAIDLPHPSPAAMNLTSVALEVADIESLECLKQKQPIEKCYGFAILGIQNEYLLSTNVNPQITRSRWFVSPAAMRGPLVYVSGRKNLEFSTSKLDREISVGLL